MFKQITVITLFLLFGCSNNVSVVETERQFFNIISESKIDYKKSSNSALKEATRKQRADKFRKFNSEYPVVENWYGKVFLIKNAEKEIRLDVKLPNGTILTTRRSGILNDDVHIQKGSQVYRDFINTRVSKGNKILFSGRFLRGDEDDFFVNNKSGHQAMTCPEFVFIFEKIKEYMPQEKNHE